MRIKLFTFRYSATLGGFDDTSLLEFTRDKEIVAFREHFYAVNEVPHVTCVLTYQDAVIPLEVQQAALGALEELGLKLCDNCMQPLIFASHSYPDFHLLMPLFVCRRWEGIPLAHEGQALKWLRPSRMADLPMPPADRPLVAALRDLLG